MATATAIVFDLGGVLIDRSPEYLYRELIPDRRALIKAWWTRRPETFGGEIPGTRPLVEELFDGVIVSGHKGAAKPDPRLFELFNDRFDLDLFSTAYVDD